MIKKLVDVGTKKKKNGKNVTPSLEKNKINRTELEMA